MDGRVNRVKHSAFYLSPVGWIRLVSDEISLKSLDFVEKTEENLSLLPQILDQSLLQLKEYFEGKRTIFDLVLDPEGSEFQQLVWKLVREIDFGKTKTYSDLAKELGSINFSRAVGMANGRNPLPIIVPCHRVIGIKGKLVGYSGGLERKKWLLNHEQQCSGNLLL